MVLSFCPKILGLWWGTYEGPLSFCECRWHGDSTWRWWGHLITTFCNQICLNFLHQEVVGIQKPSLDCPHTLTSLNPHALMPSHPSCPHALVLLMPSHVLCPSYPCTLMPSCPCSLAPLYPCTIVPYKLLCPCAFKL